MAPGCIAPMCIRVKDHSNVLCEQLQQLRQQTGLVDLDIVCEGHYIKVHKVVMAASSKFFKEQLCKYNVQALVILRLEDFGLELKRDALNYIIEFIYTGEVNILGEKLTDFCQAAYNLGVIGLEHLPVPARPAPVINKDHILIADESELRGVGPSGSYHLPAHIHPQDSAETNSKLPMEVHPFLNSLNTGVTVTSSANDEIVLLHTERVEQIRNEGGNVADQQDIIPISFGDNPLNAAECIVSDQYRNIQEILPRNILHSEMLQESNFGEDWPAQLFSTHPSHIQQTADLSRLSTRQVKAPVSVASNLNPEISMGINGPQANLQALFDAASSGVDIAQSGQAAALVKTTVTTTPSLQHKTDSSQQLTTAASISTTATTAAAASPTAASPRLAQSRPPSRLEFKQLSGGTVSTIGGVGSEYPGAGVLPPLPSEKMGSSPCKSLSQGKLRVINQGLQKSENIQTPSLNLKDTNKNRRRSGAHSHAGHIPSQVSQVALSAQVSHTHATHATPASAGPSGAVRTSVRLMTVAATADSAVTAEQEEANAIAAENDSDSESGEEQDNSITNTGISTPLANWSAEESWPSTNRENNWTHPVDTVDTVPPSGAVWQLPTNPPASSGSKTNSSIAASWNIRDHSSDITNVQRPGSPIPWNIPVTNTWCTVPREEEAPTKWEGGHTASTTTTNSRATPPSMTVSWTHPETSPSVGGGGQEGEGRQGQGEGESGGRGEGAESNSSSNSSVDNESMENSEPGLTWTSTDSWPRTNTDKMSEGRDMLAIRSGIPLALQNKAIRSGVPIGPFQNKRKRKSKSLDSNRSKKRGSISRGRGDLEVRKDLTIESQQHRDAVEAEDGGGVEADHLGGQEDLVPGLLIEEEENSCNSAGEDSSLPLQPPAKDPLSPSTHLPSSAVVGGGMGTGNVGGGGGVVHIKTVTKLNSELDCDQCGKSFYESGQLFQHMKLHHNTEQIYCPTCKEKCDCKESLKVHLYRVHGIGEVFRCEECNFETPSKPGYIKHIGDHIPSQEKQKKCFKCKKVFKTKYGLKLHLKEHFDEMLSCSVCEFQTAQKSNLARHMASKHGQDLDGRLLDENYACPKCHFRCVTEHILKNHMLRKHTEKEAMRYHCEHCEYATVEKAALDKHRRFKHTNERPFMCDTCGFSTATASSMARHKRSHSQTKPHKCDICGHEYADRKRLRDHMYLHSDYKPFKCDFCSYTCRRMDHLTAHVKRQHKTTKEEKEIKAVIPDSTSDTSAQHLPKVLENSEPAIPSTSSVLSSHSISTIDMSQIS